MRRKIRSYLSRNGNKIETCHVQIFFVFGQNAEEPQKKVIYRKKRIGDRAFKRVMHVYRYKNTHHHGICLCFLLSVRTRCMMWRDIAT